MARAIYWLRNDLRLTCNPLLMQAIAENHALVCVYIHDPRQFARTLISIPRMGWHRRRFLSQSLQQLREDLGTLQIELLELWGEPESVLPQLADELQIDAVYFSRECAPEERSVEAYTCAHLDPTRIKVTSAWTGFLINPEQLPFAVGETPDIFSEYRRQVERLGLKNIVSQIAEYPESSLKRVDQHQTLQMTAYRAVQKTLPSLFSEDSWAEIFPEENDLLDGLGAASGPRDKMKVLCGGERHGKARVEDYIFKTHSIKNYFETRNGLLGLYDSTLFSAWLANGSLSPVWIFSRVKAFEQQHGSSKNTEWVIVELLWRDFFRLMLLKYDVKFFLPQGIHGKPSPRSRDEGEIMTHLSHVLTASTSQRFINANMRELVQTGFMSNRGRQNVASFMIHDLKIPWTYGAWCFESLLIDYDPASNWGNWAYLAGVGNDPRGSRVFNIERQQHMYDPDGHYVAAWG